MLWRRETNRVIFEKLMEGHDNAISMALLAIECKCSERDIRRAVQYEREKGALILSDNNGYYLPSADPERAHAEINSFFAMMKTRERKTSAMIEGMRRSCQKGWTFKNT